MKLKRVLASILCFAMVLSTMSFTALAGTSELDEADFDTNNGVVFDGANYYASLTEALAGVHAQKDAVLYCKPDADLGTMTHGHVCQNLTIYGNGAYLSGGEQDFEVDMYECPGIGPVGSGLTEDVTLTVYNLTGAGAWGTRQSDYTVNFVFEDCQDMGKIYLTGINGKNNITLTDCTFTSNDVSACKVYSNAAGTITLTNVDFSNVDQPVALNNKSTGTQTICLTDCDFNTCGAATYDWTVPVSIKSSVDGGNSVVTVDNCTFAGTVANSIGQDADILLDFGDGETTATILNTAAKVGVETEANVADYATLTTEDVASMTNESATVNALVAKIGDVYYTTLKEAIYDAVDGDTIYLMNEINEGSIKLPATIANLTIDGQNTAVVKDTVITAADGNSVNYQGLTIKNTTFDNSRFVLGGMRNGDVIYKDLVFDNNKFINIVNTASMAAVHMNLGSEDNEYVENFTFTNNVIDGVTGSNNSGVVLKSITGNVIFEGNTVSNVAWNAVQIATAKDDANLVIKNNSFTSSGSSVLNIAAAPSVVLENNTVVNDSGRTGLWYPAEAKIGDVLYTDIKTAVDAAEDGAVITLVDDVTFSDVLAYADRNAKTWNGSYAFDLRITKELTLDLNGFTLKSTGGSDVQHYAIICVDGKGNLTVVDSSDEKTGAIINATTSRPAGKMSVVLYNEAGDITLNGGTYSNQARVDGNYPYVIDSITAGDTSLTINEGVKLVSDGYMTLRAMSQGGAGTQTVNITGGEFEGGIWAVLKNGVKDVLNFTISGGTFTAENAFIVENYAAPAEGSTVDTVSITGGTFNGNVGIGANNVANLLADGFISGGTYTTNVSAYAAEGFDVVRTADKYVVEAESDQADGISVVYKDITDTNAEGEKTYAIVVKANDGDVINELASVDLSFVYTTAPVTGGNIDFTVAPAEKFAMTRYENTNRYMFNYNGVGNNYEGTAAEITVGTIKVVGYGKFTIATDTADTNIVNATAVNDNLVDSYTVAGATDNDATTGALDITGNVDTVIAVPTRTLTINLDFPNAVEDNTKAYQDMKVEITGNIDGVNKTVVYNLGEDEVAMANGSYVVTEGKLVLNNAYTVTVSGAGYRTARYTVTMTEDKVLKFWNNVMDEKQFVEIGKESSKVNVTFLAGDIVKDNNINIYDLSAVVSYFGQTNDTAAYSDYAKYDLNRDGVIDSKDVAYVLVSWDK